MVGEPCGFGGAVADFKQRPLTQEFFTGSTHFFVGFDCDDGVAVGEKDFGEHAGSCTDVRDVLMRLQVAPAFETIENDCGGIAEAEAIVGFDASRKSLDAVHDSMIEKKRES